MFNFLSRSQRHYPTIRQALVQAGLSAAGDPTRVAVLEKHGQYAGRRVNFFRAFEPGHQDLLLGSGHVEREGLVGGQQPARARGRSTSATPCQPRHPRRRRAPRFLGCRCSPIIGGDPVRASGDLAARAVNVDRAYHSVTTRRGSLGNLLAPLRSHILISGSQPRGDRRLRKRHA